MYLSGAVSGFLCSIPEILAPLCMTVILFESTPNVSKKDFITTEGQMIASAFFQHLSSISLIFSRVLVKAEEIRDGISIDGRALTS